MPDFKTYSFSDLVGFSIYAGAKGIYIYRVNKSTGKRFVDKTLKAGAFIGKLKSFQIYKASDVGTDKEIWVFIFSDSKGTFFIFIPKNVPNIVKINESELKAAGVKTEEEKLIENQNKYNKSPFDAFVDVMTKNKIFAVAIGVAALFSLNKLSSHE